ncbi:MAG: nucleoside deaminase [Bacteriovoracales bacterium]|nr:nucleoside deaminase [Bacteriovoracales bacterium]
MQEKFMRRAIELSRVHMRRGDGGPFGAVIVKGDQIVAEGHNCVTSSFDPTAHAEVVAIRQACRKLEHFQLEGLEIYTSCWPCPMCLAAIYWARIKKIYFANTKEDAQRIGFSDADFYRELEKTPSLRRIPSHQLLREEAGKVFEEWEAKADRVNY